MGTDPIKHTRETIIDRLDSLLRERRQIRERRHDLAIRDRMIDREIADCRAAARLFGHNDISFPPDEAEEYIRLRGFVENNSYSVDARPRAIQQSLPLAKDNKKKSAQSPTVVRKMPRIRDIVLDRLKEAGAKGTKALAIKRYIESTYGKAIHYKTVGMTLYRLSQEEQSVVRRDGQTWFFVSHDGETKNPGVEAPGHIYRE